MCFLIDSYVIRVLILIYCFYFMNIHIKYKNPFFYCYKWIKLISSAQNTQISLSEGKLETNGVKILLNLIDTFSTKNPLLFHCSKSIVKSFFIFCHFLMIHSFKFYKGSQQKFRNRIQIVYIFCKYFKIYEESMANI